MIWLWSVSDIICLQLVSNIFVTGRSFPLCKISFGRAIQILQVLDDDVSTHACTTALQHSLTTDILVHLTEIMRLKSVKCYSASQLNHTSRHNGHEFVKFKCKIIKYFTCTTICRWIYVTKSVCSHHNVSWKTSVLPIHVSTSTRVDLIIRIHRSLWR